MNDPTSLDRLHDLVLPPAVSWWPLASGWYVVIVLFLVAAVWVTRRAWKRWRSNAYRREALQKLASLDSSTAIAELLRRTALAIAPRPEIAEMTGDAWLDWLSRKYPEAMPDTVRLQLTSGVYGPAVAGKEISLLRDYAARWISLHQAPRC